MVDVLMIPISNKLLDWKDCWDCGGECFTHHECGEDTCCCINPYDNVICTTCNGKGGWEYTDSDQLEEDKDIIK
jgi:hypothetical protein